jgi:hypothetical protein
MIAQEIGTHYSPNNKDINQAKSQEKLSIASARFLEFYNKEGGKLQ